MATQNLGSILVRSIQFEEKGPLFRRGDRNDDTIVVQNGTLEGAGHTIQENTVDLASRANLNFGNGLTATDNPGTDASDVVVDVASFSGIDHGTQLVGLGDDDHTQYLLIDGSRAMSGGLVLGTFNQFSDSIFVLGDDNYILANAVRMINLSTSIGGVLINPTSGVSQRLLVRNQTNDSEVLNVITSTIGQRVQMSARDATATTAILELLKQTNAASVNVLDIKGDRNFTTPGQAADDDEIYIRFILEDSGNAEQEYARITAKAPTIAAGSEGGSMRFSASCSASGGTLQEFFRFDGSSGNEGSTFNPLTSADFDFFVRGTGGNILQIDAGIAGIGFFAVAPVNRPGATEDIKDALASLGLLTNGGISPLNLDGGAITCGNIVTSGFSQFNSGAGAFNFLVSSDNEVNMLFINGATDEMGIGGGIVSGVILNIEDDTDTASREILRLSGNRATPTDGDSILLGFHLQDAGFGTHPFAQILCFADDVSSGTEDGRLSFTVACGVSGGGLVTMLDIDSEAEAVIVNPSGGTIADLQVMGSGGVLNILRVDVGTNNIGMGGTPSSVTFISIEGGVATRGGASGIAAGMNFPADTYTRNTTGTLAIGAMVGLDIPTLAATGASTFTDAATLYIQGAPAAGANMTLTRTVALWVDAGATRLDGLIQVGGVAGSTTFETTSTLIVFNEDGGDRDFRIEADHFLGLIDDFVFIDSGNAVMSIGGGVLGAWASTPLTISRTINEAASTMLRLESLRSTRADANNIQITFFQPSDNGTSSQTGTIINEFVDVTTASRDSHFAFQTMRGGAVRDSLLIGHTIAGVFEFGFDQSTQVRSTYTRNATVVEDRTLLQSSAATTLNNNNVLAAIIADLQAHGLFLGT